MATEPDDGVDETLIEELLALSVEERLRLNDSLVATVAELRRAFAPPCKLRPTCRFYPYCESQ